MTRKNTTRPLACTTKEILCPLCAQALPQHDFLHTPDYAIVVRAAHVATLSAQEAAAFKLLLDNRDKRISHEQLTRRVYVSNGGPQWAKGAVYCLVKHLREKLRPLKIVIPSLHHSYQVLFR